MDAYLASGDLRSASHFYLNFNFEVLNGCKLKCPGCHVETNAQLPFSSLEQANFLKLLQDMKNSLYVPFIAFIGPTDFLSADNFLEIFSNPDIIQLMHNFTRFSLQTTFLDVRRSELAAKLLRDYYFDMEIEINLIVDPAKIMDDQYLKVIEKNQNTFLNLLEREDVRSFGIMNVYDYDKTKIPEILRDYDIMHNRVSHLFDTTIDYNFSFGRNPDISNEEFLSLCFRIKELFDSSLNLSTEKSQYLRFSFGKLTDSLIERQYNYRNGKLYHSPLLYERFVSFRSEFEVPLTEFSASEIEKNEMKLQMEQYLLAPSMEECESCPFLGSCVDRGILHLMDTYGTKKCLVAKEALASVNSMKPLSGVVNAR